MGRPIAYVGGPLVPIGMPVAAKAAPTGPVRGTPIAAAAAPTGPPTIFYQMEGITRHLILLA